MFRNFFAAVLIVAVMVGSSSFTNAGLNVSRGTNAKDVPPPVTGDGSTVPDATQLPDGSLIVREAEIDNFRDESKVTQDGEHSMVLIDPTPKTALKALESREKIATIEEEASADALKQAQGTATSKEAQEEVRTNMAAILAAALEAQKDGDLERYSALMDQYHKLASHLPSDDDVEVKMAGLGGIGALFGNIYVIIGIVIFALAVIAFWLIRRRRNNDDDDAEGSDGDGGSDAPQVKRARGSRGSGKGGAQAPA